MSGVLKRFTKKPVTIEAIQWTGKLECLDPFNIPELHQSLGSSQVGIPTLEGTMIASVGDWIIKGVKGEFYPCKPEIFALTYGPESAPQGALTDALPELPNAGNATSQGTLMYYAGQMHAYARQYAQQCIEASNQQGDAWQPIETAPKDGSEILLCRAIDADKKPMGDSFGLFVQRAAWWASEGWIVYCSMIQEPRCFFEPTHWMPIPAPPAIEQRKADKKGDA